MKITYIFFVILLALVAWWYLAAPPDYHPVPGRITFDDRATGESAQVEQSAEFARYLEILPSDLPGHDDVLFLPHRRTLLASAMDGQIWTHEIASGLAIPLLDVPLMAAGMHESVGKHDELYFCASHLWGESYSPNERVGLYRLSVPTRRIESVVLDVPATEIRGTRIWALDDPTAPALVRAGQESASGSRPLAFCNDLEISADGERIYFSEPFAYEGASMGGGTVAEAISFHGNGRVWVHNLVKGETRLVAEGLFFPDGILYDLHPGDAREESIIVSLTPGFSLVRLYVAGPRAGSHEVVQEGLGGMCDGLDRDQAGNIWCAMYARRTGFLTWLHRNPWAKHILLRLPLNWIPQPATTGVLAFNSDASEMLYSAWYEGGKARHIASAIPGPDGFIYLTPFSREHRGLVRLPDPLAPGE